MSNEEQHINPWADKLHQAPLPDVDASWKGMEQLLHQHMPVPEKERKRRFFFILFPVLLLVIGTGLMMVLQRTRSGTNKQETVATASTSTVAGANKKSAAITTTVATSDITSTKDSIIAQNNAAKANTVLKASNETAIKTSGAIEKDKGAEVNRIGAKAYNIDETTTAGNKGNFIPATKNNKKTKQPTKSFNAENNVIVTAARKKLIKQKERIASSWNDTLKKGSQPALAAVSTSNDYATSVKSLSAESYTTLITTVPSYKGRLDPLRKEILIDSFFESTIPDSLWQRPNKKEIILKGWTFGIGINHFFLLPAQSSSEKDMNSEGVSNTIRDYIPVPQARYYFNNKLFAQAELQVNAPQLVQNVLLEEKTTQQGSLVFKDEVYIRKLSYFNLPLSLHYSPIKKLYLGVGIQASRLNNAVAIIEQSVSQGTLPDSSKKTFKVQSIKNDTTYKRLHTSELRLLGDVSYQLKRFTAGMRYNYALSDFVKVPVAATGVITQARNHSLQVYLRYTFLDKRKKVKPR